VGEIGRDRHEYLYDMMFWEILLIQRGYRHRHVLQYQLERLAAYGSFFCMSGTKQLPFEWLPLYFDRYISGNEPKKNLSIEEQEDLMADIAAFNADVERKMAADKP